MASNSNLVFTFTGNKDSGSLPVKELPVEFRQNGSRPTNLSIHITGEAKPRKVTYVMGSDAKGWSVCCKGAGQFPTDGEYTLIVD